ncbi:MAG TPA: hypothetical protein VFP84_31895 [Kofleriaceae bacterium]|nr:hypothetical protein [Kofleriaceae bacterium]
MKSQPGNGPDGGGFDGGGPGAATGSLVWQQNLFGMFPNVLVASGPDLYLGAGQFSTLTLGNTTLVPGGGIDDLSAHFATADGAVKSAWRHGVASNEEAIGFAIDPAGNYAIGGLYNGAGNANFGGADLPPAPPPPAGFEAVAASYNEAGTLRWLTPITGSALAFPSSTSTNSSGLTSVTGRFAGALTIGGQAVGSAAGGTDAFYAAFDDTGKLVTFVAFGGTGDDQGTVGLFDPLNTVVVAGSFSGQVNFGTFARDAGNDPDVFVVRMTRQGTPMWALQGSTAGVSQIVAAVAPGGDIILAAGYLGTFQLTGGEKVTSHGDLDIALARIASDGTVRWTRSFGGGGPDSPRAIAVGRHDEIALSAEFEAQASFGGDTFTSNGGQDAVVAKYTGDGAHVWSHAAGGAGVDRGLGIAIDDAGAVYAAISFHNAINFGGAPISAETADYAAAMFKFAP